MGQEISQQNKCSIRRQQLQQAQLQPPHKNPKHSQLPSSTEKYTRHNNDLTYASSIISTASSKSTDDEHYQLRQKYHLNKQTYEKSKVAKKLSVVSNATTKSDTSDYQLTSVTSHKSSDCGYNKHSSAYNNARQQHQRQNSHSTDSGIYYSSCHCASLISSSAASTASIGSTSGCGCSQSLASSSNKSRKSLDKQKNYLCRHLYIKSYLDILEEDEKARAHFQPARPGGIRNYKPKILADSTLSTSAPLASSFGAKQREKCSKDDPWI